MIGALIRKLRHVQQDPVLRRWLIRKIAGLERKPGEFVQGRPPYLSDAFHFAPGSGGTLSNADFPDGSFTSPSYAIRIALPGMDVDLSPGDASRLFDRSYDDLETLLAVHRFAWVPIGPSELNRDWVAAIWRCWFERFGHTETGWPWHAYTVAERAINIVDFSRRFGLPGERPAVAKILSRHGEVIRANLEYFGEHYTSNHLSNNGRGLLRIGTALGRTDFAELGARIMVAEAGRIFARSGVLREGSTHYHQLVTRNYLDAWVDAQAAGMEQADLLKGIAERAVAVLPGLRLPGGMPLIGDISPDVPPAYLKILGEREEGVGWPSGLSPARQQRIRSLIDGSLPVSPDKLAADGWHGLGMHGWHALTYVADDGWPPMPGHAHHDLGSFELHDGDMPIIVDPGRGSYADTEYEGADVHNGVQIDAAGPMPINRAYYSTDFRKRVVSRPPKFKRTREGGILSDAGFQHLSGIGAVEREWRFLDTHVSIVDRISGAGRRTVQRSFCTPHNVRTDGDAVMINTGSASYRLSFGSGFSLKKITCWRSYGDGQPGTQIVAEVCDRLPLTCKAIIERA